MKIAELQQTAENDALASGAPLVVADTDQMTIALWWSEKYAPAPFLAVADTGHGTVGTDGTDQPPVRRSYLLCYPDIAWQPDPLRENPNDRHRLFRLQMQRLEAAQAGYRVIWGNGKFRERLAWQYVKSLRDQ